MIYMCVFIASTFFAYLAGRSKDKATIILCSVISILIPSILGGIRSGLIGIDTGGYGIPDALTAKNASSWFEFAGSGHEQGYRTVVYLVMKIFDHPNWAIFAHQLITHTCVYIGAYKHKHLAPLHYIILVYLISIYFSTYAFLRQYIAASIIFLGIDKLEKQQYAKFSIYIIIATFFHSSAPIAFFLLMGVFMLSSDKYLKNQYLRYFLIGIALIASVLAGALIRWITLAFPVFEKYEGSVGNIALGASGSIRANLMYIVQLVMCFLYKKGSMRTFAKLGDEDIIKFYKANLYCLLLYVNFVGFASVRIIIYQRIVNIILLAALPSFVKEKHLKFIIAVGVILSLLLNFYMQTQMYDMYPFQTFFGDVYY